VELNRQGDPNSCSPPSPALDARRCARARAELAALAALPPHPLLPTLYDAFTSREGRRVHVVLTHVPGTDLSARLQAADGCAPHALPRAAADSNDTLSASRPRCAHALTLHAHTLSAQLPAAGAGALLRR
jgi:hypothetical protein